MDDKNFENKTLENEGFEEVVAKKEPKSKKTKLVVLMVACFLVIILLLSGFLIYKNYFYIDKDVPVISVTESEEKSNTDFKLFEKGFTDVKIKDEKTALKAIESVCEHFGISDPSNQLRFVDSSTVDTETFYRFDMMYNNIPVYAKSVIISADKKGVACALTSNVSSLEDSVFLNPKRAISEEKADKYLKHNLSGIFSYTNKGLVVYTLNTQQPILAYHYVVEYKDDKDEYYEEELFLSAFNGEILFRNDMRLFSKEKKLESYVTKVGDQYYLYDKERNLVLVNSNEKVIAVDTDNNRIDTYLVEESSVLDSDNNYDVELFNKLASEKRLDNSFIKDANVYLCEPISYVSSNSNEWDEAENYMKSATSTYDFFDKILGHKGYDGKNSQMYIACNDGVDNGENSYSNRSFLLAFGHRENSKHLDLVAHEFTHSVESSISMMHYCGESGAIMEACSDVFAELVEDYSNDKKFDNDCNWLFEKKRSHKKPGDGDAPSSYKGEYWADTSSLSDRGGVHTNSTVLSHAAYLMANGIDGGKTKISTELLTKIFYKTFYYLQKDATFKQFADSVYLAATNTQGVSAKQCEHIKKAFTEVGIYGSDCNYQTLVHNGTTIFALDKNGNKDFDYYIEITDISNKSVVVDEIIKDKKGYKFDLPDGTYKVTVSDNKKDASKTKYIKYISVVPNLRQVDSTLNILTNFYFDYDKLLKEKRDAVISKYGVASVETYKRNTSLLSPGWANRNGVVSAALIDMDDDSINELLTVRIIKGSSEAYSHKLELEVFYIDYPDVKSAGTYQVPYGYLTDVSEMYLNAYFNEATTPSNVFVEFDYTQRATDVRDVAYYAFGFNDGKFELINEILCETGELPNYNIISKDDVESIMTAQLHLRESNSSFPVTKYPMYYDSNGVKQICSFSTEKVEPENHSNANRISYATDYTGLDHSKATSFPEKSEDWKAEYVEFLESDEVDLYTYGELIYLNDDSVPEMVLISGSALPGAKICWVSGDKLQTYDITYSNGCSYTPKSGFIGSGYMNMGIETSAVFKFNGTSLALYYSSQKVPVDQMNGLYQYYINKKEVSEEEFDSFSKVKLTHTIYEKSVAISKLKDIVISY
ncbi:MAG: hypothetical protein E7513_01610 [Ruminococcaceae bacterium]|nr:hypothetical protein [Oscillospiraceae bacterium]